MLSRFPSGISGGIKSYKGIWVLFFVMISTLSEIHAQSTYALGIFPTIDHSGTLSKKIDYSLYYFAAFPLFNFNNSKIEEDSYMLLFYAEQALSYNVTSNLSFTASYLYQRERIAEDAYVNENRIHVQSTYKHALHAVNLKHRLRFDIRFITNPAIGETQYKDRLRYLIGITVPIRSRNNNVYFTAYEEAFFNTFKGAEKIYAENWAYAAIGVKLNSKNSVETGPLYITWNTGGNNWFNQYYLQVTWVSHVNFSRKLPANE